MARARGEHVPYVAADGVTLYQGDCLAVMRSLPDACVDALITDPPYCAGAVGEAQRTRAPGQGVRAETIRRFGWFTGDNMGTAGLAWLLRMVAFESMRLVKPTGSLLIFCDWRMVSSLQPAIESAGVRFQGLLVWDKGSMGLGQGFRNQHELILHFTLGAPAYHDRATGNVLWAERIGPQERAHQTQKPVPLLRRLIRVACPPGGTVLDCLMGSGSTGVASALEHCCFIGIERDATSCRLAQERITRAYAAGVEIGTPAGQLALLEQA